MLRIRDFGRFGTVRAEETRLIALGVYARVATEAERAEELLADERDTDALARYRELARRSAEAEAE